MHLLVEIGLELQLQKQRFEADEIVQTKALLNETKLFITVGSIVRIMEKMILNGEYKGSRFR